MQCEFLSTTQFATDINRQMLRQTELFILCRGHFPKGTRYYRALARHTGERQYWAIYYALAQKAYIELFVFDVWGNFTGSGFASRNWPPPPEMADKRIILRNLYKVWDDYETDIPTTPQWADKDSRLRQVKRYWEEDDIRGLGDAEEEDDSDDAQYINEFSERVQRGKDIAQPFEVVIPSSIQPQTLDDWVAKKAFSGTFVLNPSAVKQARAFDDGIHTIKDLEKIFRARGFVISDADGRRIARVPQ
jgi:hypothetical protein